MTEEQLEICHDILEHYGLQNQFGILQEECAELIQAVSKFNRSDKSNGLEYATVELNLLYEIADVMIMLHQIKIGLKISDNDLSDVIDYKLDRQLARIRKEEFNEQSL